jgi:hypothetical protein
MDLETHLGNSIQLQLFDSDSDFYVKKINHITAMALISQHHYLKGLSHAAQNFGAFKNGVLLGVVSFAVPVNEDIRIMIFGKQYKDHVKELVRLCLHPNCEIPASKIVSKAIDSLKIYRSLNNMIPVYGIISFADMGQGHHGGVYQAMSWLYIGKSKFTMKKYFDSHGRSRHPKQNGINISPKEAKKKGWTVKIEKSIKHKYLKILGSKKQKKVFRKRLKLPIEDYPKS